MEHHDLRVIYVNQRSLLLTIRTIARSMVTIFAGDAILMLVSAADSLRSLIGQNIIDKETLLARVI